MDGVSCGANDFSRAVADDASNTLCLKMQHQGLSLTLTVSALKTGRPAGSHIFHRIASTVAVPEV